MPRNTAVNEKKCNSSIEADLPSNVYEEMKLSRNENILRLSLKGSYESTLNILENLKRSSTRKTFPLNTSNCVGELRLLNLTFLVEKRLASERERADNLFRAYFFTCIQNGLPFRYFDAVGYYQITEAQRRCSNCWLSFAIANHTNLRQHP